MPKRLEIKLGSRYNRLTVIKETDPEIRYNKNRVTPLRRFDCVCDCGKQVNARMSALIDGSTKSCGCFKNQNVTFDKTTHGLSKTHLYHIWGGMIQRCENDKHPAYHNYGGRGISVCLEWRNDFRSFHDWAVNNGWDKDLEIDRRNNNLGYCPENCRIVTTRENCNNTRRNIMVLCDDEELTLTKACEKIGIDYHLVRQRMRVQGWSFEESVNRKKWQKLCTTSNRTN